MTVFDNPYIKQLGLLPLPQQQQQSPLEGLLSPRGLTAFGINMLANPNGNFFQQLGQGMGGAVNAVDAYNQSLDKQAMDSALYNLKVGEIAANYDIAGRELEVANAQQKFMMDAFSGILGNRATQPNAATPEYITIPDNSTNANPAGILPQPAENVPSGNRAKYGKFLGGIMDVTNSPAIDSTAIRGSAPIDSQPAIPTSPKATFTPEQGALLSILGGSPVPFQLAQQQAESQKSEKADVRESYIPNLEYANPDILPTAQAAKDAKEAYTAYQSANNLITQLQNLYDKEGTANTFMSGDVSESYDTLIGSLLTEYKTLKKLGTLDKGTQELFDQIVTAPNSVFSTGRGFKTQLKILEEGLRKNAEDTITASGYKFPKDKPEQPTNEVKQPVFLGYE